MLKGEFDIHLGYPKNQNKPLKFTYFII